MLIAQSRHRTKLARQKKRHVLTVQTKKLQSILQTLPDSYWTPELKDFIFQSLINALKQQLELSPSQRVFLQNDIDLYSSQRHHQKNRIDNVFANAGNIDMTTANLYKSLLRTIHKFVQESYQHKRIGHTEAEKMIEQAESKLVEASCDFYSCRGRWHIKNKQFREARNLYQKAIDNLLRSKFADQYSQQQIIFEQKLKEIQVLWREHTAERQETNNNTLQRNFDSWEEENRWQQKQDYD